MNLFLIIVAIIFLAVIGVRTYSKLQDQKLLRTVTQPYRGTSSERAMILKLLKFGAPNQTIFHDLYLINQNGTYTQIDLVVATKVGIVVFEVKEYSGWIFGNESQKNWTQVLAYGQHKYRFYNPILQNKKHIEDLIKQLPQFENIPFYSVVVFWGDCTFKDVSIPIDTFLVKSKKVMEVVKRILSENQPVNYTNKREVVDILIAAVKNGENNEIPEKHIKNIQSMQSKARFD